MGPTDVLRALDAENGSACVLFVPFGAKAGGQVFRANARHGWTVRVLFPRRAGGAVRTGGRSATGESDKQGVVRRTGARN